MAADRNIEIALCVFREANDALVVFDPRDRKVVDLNPAALRLTGLSKKLALTLEINDLLSSPDPALFHNFLDASHRTGFFHSREGYELSRKDSPPIPVNVSVSRIHTRPEPLALAMIRDITGRKKVEEELRQARDELESRVQERTAELLQAKDAAESAGRVKDRFLSVLSHELRTPLTPVLAVVSAMLDDPSTSDALRPTLEMIRRSVSLEARLIDDLLNFTRFEQGPVRLEIERIDIHALLDQAAELCQPEVESAGVRLIFEREARASIVEADPTRLLQVACNLIQNAVKFTHEGGTIAIQTTDGERGRLVVTVVDDGRGIEPEALSTIFEPFEQGPSTTARRHGGLGLGLSIGRSIIEAHGGTLSAASDGPGRGSSFRFDLPEAKLTKDFRPIKPTSVGSTKGLNLLVVEDNKDVLRYLKLVLEMQGHQVSTAVDLASAREALIGAFDLLISDIELPDGSGLDLMRELRGRKPGLAISGFGSPEDIRLSLEAGFLQHLTKPVAIDRLEAAIREVMAEFVRKPGSLQI
jgi:PAS domain S-box-containing protein